MVSVPSLLLLLGSASQTLVDQVFQVPAGEWRYVSIALKQVPATAECDFHVIAGSGAVRVQLVNREGLDDWKQGARDGLGSAPFQSVGVFRRLVSVADEYAVVLESSRQAPATVRLRVSLDFSDRSRPQARYLSSERRFAVIVISATVFLAIVIYSARRLSGAIRT
jgi:hypothetical protein